MFITESASLAEAATPADGPGRILVKIIDEGKGSSGTYPKATLQEAAKDKVFKAGTLMFVDHPSAMEAHDRPERTVKDLAAVLEDDATYRDGGLYAPAKVFSHWRQPIADMAESIGVSIRASAEIDESSGERVVTKLVEAASVDFVTQAGRGGKVMSVLESARPVQEARNIGQWLEARLHSDFTHLADDSYGDGRLTRDERITLSNALGEALTAFTSRIESDAPQLFQRDLWEDPEPAEEAHRKDSPSAPAGVVEENKKGAEMPTIEVEEREHRNLVERSSRVDQLEREMTELRSENETLSESNRTIIAESNREAAQAIVAEAFDGIEAPATVRLLAESYTVNDEGRIDKEALRTRAKESAAEISEAHGAGSVRGLGSTNTGGDEITEESVNTRVASAFGRTPKKEA